MYLILIDCQAQQNFSQPQTSMSFRVSELAAAAAGIVGSSQVQIATPVGSGM